MFERFIIPFFGSFMAASVLCGGLYLSSPPIVDGTPAAPWIQPADAGPEVTWRHTSDGWQNSTDWRVEKDEARVRFIDRIHPVTWTVIVLLLAIGAAVLVSDDWNVKRLWSKKPGESTLPT
jgi:hypothetical protein